MIIKRIYQFLTKVTLVILISSCVTPFEEGTSNFEDLLVVEALITDENIKHEVFLSRVFRLDDNQRIKENNATVKIVDGTDQEYEFEETAPGKYKSITNFMVKPNQTYQLIIITSKGKTYKSTVEKTPVGTELEKVEAIITTNDNGIEGIGIMVNSFSESNGPSFFRYVYEETYEIRPPFPTPLKPVIPYEPIVCSDLPVLTNKTVKDDLCYKTDFSNTILLANTVNLNENRIEAFEVRFIDKVNSIIRDRYSILIKQFTESRAAFDFYKKLDDFSDSESLFSQLQTGFIQGNISSINDPNEKVLGFFEVATVNSKRIFLNYEDFFPGEEKPPFFIECTPIMIDNDMFSEAINKRSITYLFSDCSSSSDQGPHTVVNISCSDCRLLGSVKVPDFWQEN